MCFHLCVRMQGSEKPGAFSMNLLHVHGEAAFLLHAVVDLCQLWHLCSISDSLQPLITEPTCTYSLWGEWHFITNWKVLTMPEVQTQINLKCKIFHKILWTGHQGILQLIWRLRHCVLPPQGGSHQNLAQPVFQKGICQADRPEFLIFKFQFSVGIS